MKYQLTIGWLYPELMSTYGDRGNIIVFQKRCDWREIEVLVLPITTETKLGEIRKVDIFFGGGAQDREQEIVINDLEGEKGKIIIDLIENNIPALFVCGSPQLMGNYYEPAVGKRIKGLGIFDMNSVHPGENIPRCIGNVVAKILIPELEDEIIVGFENHGGRSFLGKSAKPFAKVIKGFGNNGEDRTEGVLYKNAIGSYLHGPLLPKNPHIADYVIKKALEVKYKHKVELIALDDELENKAKNAVLNRLNLADQS